ncbi:small nuclear ribonucleoprotein G [Fusarium sp. NRRL 25303]|uniref:Probable small nuclear ribonucleoprotein n=1 Tax=Fusarium mangiferae TaxID=192010 RepID=A0A1L7SJR6_FUSMA|nr:putative small nuclear ribonucleoprotein [Fusarium mangiferae]KAF5627171.1 small nuclear ribonucleoprotein G [Fusarium sp. NRRL 25303]CVK84673.1 probable small nuclear ribonucleoprotein [Fusarium mangiferae]
MAPAQPELKKASLGLFLPRQETRQVFLNIVLDEAVEEKDGGEKERIGMVVIRGNSVVMLEALERIGGDDRRGDR